MAYSVITFYDFTQIEDPDSLRDTIRSKCEELGLMGRILLGHEGINGGACGTIEDVKAFKQWLESFPEYTDMTYRELACDKNVYHKLVVRTREEIVVLGKEVDMSLKGEYVNPVELKEMYDSNEDFVILDMRNDYEFDVGHFKNALKVPMKTFRDLPGLLTDFEQYKDKKIVTYCTGGIRCEKATALMHEAGFKDVKQLHGGVINFVEQCPDTYWEGGLFVFDDRLVSDLGKTITQCSLCGCDCKQIINCHNLDCDRLFIVCEDCRKKYKNCCSEGCMGSERQRKKRYRTIGKVENYYAKPKVAHVILSEEMNVGDSIIFRGRTTKDIVVTVDEMRDDDGNVISCGAKGQEVTFPVSEKVRVNDNVVVEV